MKESVLKDGTITVDEMVKTVKRKFELEAELSRLKEIAAKLYKGFKEVRDNAAEAGEIMFGPKSVDYFDIILNEYKENNETKI